MPIYEYQCQECGGVTEALQKMSDPPLTDCEGECAESASAAGRGALRKILSGHVVGRSFAPRRAAPPPECGRCDQPGPCAMRN